MATGQVISVSGTLSGPKHVEKIVEVDGFDVELVPTDHMAFFMYTDRPGIVGLVGRILGDAGGNIAGMQVSRDTKGGTHAIAIFVLAFSGTTQRGASWLFCAGIFLFSGSLYTMALTNLRWLGAITPLGGLCFLAGWAWLFLAPRT